jgi:hypothetical protein
VPRHFLADRGRYLGYDISAELLNLGDSRLAAMDTAGIDVQVVSLTIPGCEGFDGETAIAIATDANPRTSTITNAAALIFCSTKIARIRDRSCHSGSEESSPSQKSVACIIATNASQPDSSLIPAHQSLRGGASLSVQGNFTFEPSPVPIGPADATARALRALLRRVFQT